MPLLSVQRATKWSVTHTIVQYSPKYGSWHLLSPYITELEATEEKIHTISNFVNILCDVILSDAKSSDVRPAYILNSWLTKNNLARTFRVQMNKQNDRVYARVACKCDIPTKRLLKGRKHVSKSVMVCLTWSNWGKTSLVQPDAKVDSLYYRENVLDQVLLSYIETLSSGDYTFQQDSAPAYNSRKLLTFCALQYRPSLNWKLASKVWIRWLLHFWCFTTAYQQWIQDVEHLKDILVHVGNRSARILLI